MRPSPWTRRSLLRAAGLSGFGTLLGLPRPARAASPARHLLFVYCRGGWDPTYLFAPLFGATGVDMPVDADPWSVGGLDLVDGIGRPQTRTFFERYAGQCGLINGMEVRSITHERCRRILLTGGTEGGEDDWAAIIAGETGSDLLLPCVVASGPAYTDLFQSSVVRLGQSGQLGDLASGAALSEADEAHAPLPDAVLGPIETYLQARLAARSASVDQEARFVQAQLTALQRRSDALRALSELTLEGVGTGLVSLRERCQPLLSCFERGLSRTALIEHKGLFDLGWDTHSHIDDQAANFEDLFSSLNLLMADLESRSAPDGGSLLDQTTIVVLSEMGRTPLLNRLGGKDHWTWTSALLIGAGVRGGTTVGGFTETLTGQAVSLPEGATTLTAAHLGATLLQIAGVDPEPWTSGASPLTDLLAP